MSNPVVWGPSGDKEYELHDHLGNVRVTVKSTPAPTSTGVANELNYYNYYAFGSYEPNRTFEVGAQYSFGFNGKEKKDDLLRPGNSYDYDVRIGRFNIIDTSFHILFIGLCAGSQKGGLEDFYFSFRGATPIANDTLRIGFSKCISYLFSGAYNDLLKSQPSPPMVSPNQDR